MGKKQRNKTLNFCQETLFDTLNRRLWRLLFLCVVVRGNYIPFSLVFSALVSKRIERRRPKRRPRLWQIRREQREREDVRTSSLLPQKKKERRSRVFFVVSFYYTERGKKDITLYVVTGKRRSERERDIGIVAFLSLSLQPQRPIRTNRRRE